MNSVRSRIAQFFLGIIFSLFVYGCGGPGVQKQSVIGASKPSAMKGFTPSASQYSLVSFRDLPGWDKDTFASAWPAWLNSCRFLNKARDEQNWGKVCKLAKEMGQPSSTQIKTYFESNFQVFELRQAQPSGGYPVGSHLGLITGYYEPEIKGSKYRQGGYQTPLHAYPERWRKNKSTPLPTRQELLKSGQLNGLELAWVEDPVAAAFMQIQGSGKILLEDGSVMRLGFAGTNDQPFKSFAQWLIDRKELTKANASMQGIQEWARKNPQRIEEMLNSNPRYVFFKPLSSQEGPIGSIGVPLVAQRSIAVDWKSIPQGAPVFLSTTYPNSSAVLERLVFAQDTGVAIVGGVRADFYWGSGDSAAMQAGRMKQAGRMWVLLPK